MLGVISSLERQTSDLIGILKRGSKNIKSLLKKKWRNVRMNYKEMKQLTEKIWQEIQKTRDAGQKEYARTDSNVFANFERTGKSLGIPPQKVLMIFLMKHFDGIISHVEGHTSQREPVTGRIKDAIVYLMLLWGMVEEENEI